MSNTSSRMRTKSIPTELKPLALEQHVSICPLFAGVKITNVRNDALADVDGLTNSRAISLSKGHRILPRRLWGVARRSDDVSP